MKCAKVSRLLLAYAARSLGHAAETEVAEHLETCARCRQELAAEERVSDGLQHVPVLTPSPSFVAQTAEEVRRVRAGTGPQDSPSGWARLILDGLVPALALTVLLIGIGFAGPRPREHRAQGQAEAILSTLPPAPLDVERLLEEGRRDRWQDESWR
jgi:anti-sigma factor RsiW